MKLTVEQKVGIALLIIGVFVTVVTHVEMDKYPNSRTYRWDLHVYIYDINPPPELLVRESPIIVIRAQEAGLMVLGAGVALLIRPSIFNREQLKYDPEKDQRRV